MVIGLTAFYTTYTSYIQQQILPIHAHRNNNGFWFRTFPKDCIALEHYSSESPNAIASQHVLLKANLY